LRDYRLQWTPFFSPYPVVTQSASSTGAVAKIAYTPGKISNVVGEERCMTNAKIEPNVIKPICTQACTAVILVVFNY